MKEEIYVINDSTLESKILQYELKDTYNMKVLDIKPFANLDTWVEDLEYHIKDVIKTMKDVIRIFIPFAFEDYQTKDIRTGIQELQRKYPQVRLIPWYEQTSKQSLGYRAITYGIAPIDKPTTAEKLKEQFEEGKTIFPKEEVKLENKTDSFEATREEYKDKRRRKRLTPADRTISGAE